MIAESIKMSQSSVQKICSKCGEYPAYMGKELCMDCLTAERAEVEKQERANNTEAYMLRWGFPKRFTGWNKDMLIPALKKLLEKCLSEKGLFITGTRGSGKTCFSTVIGKELIRQEKEVWFKNATELMWEIKSTFDKVGKIFNDYDLICNWANKPYFILDDLGSEASSEYVRQSLYVLINKRYLDNLPLIITSNLTLEEVAKRIDDRIASRLTEMCRVIDLGNKDLRVYK